MFQTAKNLGLTDAECELVLLVYRNMIQRRIFKIMQPISGDTFRGAQNYGNCRIPAHVSLNCPHCGVLNSMSVKGTGMDGVLELATMSLTCSDCDQTSTLVIMEPEVRVNSSGVKSYSQWKKYWVTPPPKDGRVNLPDAVDKELRQDFAEASLTLKISPRASAALSRYMLQNILEEQAGANKKDQLWKQIEGIIEVKALPSYLLENLDAVRHIGNFAVHPNKETETEKIIPITIEEAEFTLEVVRLLLDFYFIAPSAARKMKSNFNTKMLAAGKDENHLIDLGNNGEQEEGVEARSA